MTKRVKVELVCKAENVVVAEIETSGPLDAKAILAGITRFDVARAPIAKLILDGVQMTCGRCHEALWFRDGQGEEFAAMPASVKTL